jgi:signal transduction histidine kinase/CheY-like chemotaxis protein
LTGGGFPKDRAERIRLVRASHADGTPFLPEEWPFARAMATGTTAADELHVHRLDESDIWVAMSATPLRDKAGSVTDVVVIAIDITAAKHAEHELARARSAAEDASRSKDEFLALLGHELRNPLAPIVTALQLMRLRDGADATVRERNVIERQVRHLSRLVDDLLDLSRVARGKLELRRVPVEVSRVVASAIELASPILEQRRDRVSLDIPTSGLLVDGDEARLVQVLSNLLGNAAKYSDEGASIRLSARRAGPDAVIAVSDDGIGIDPELLPRIFDSFVQGPRSLDRSQGGLGLGLTLVRSIVELHGGSVSARSAGVGRGSEFSVRLPLARRDSSAAQQQRAEEARAQSRRRVLLVDDNVDAVAMLAELLVESGHEVLTAHDGPSALETLASFTPQVAVLDIGLPVMDGYELAAHFRARLGAQVRLVALTGYGQAADRRRALQSGFDAHLVKPVEVDALFAALDPDRKR